MPTLLPQRSWLAALAIYFRAPVITMLFLGFSAGLPFLLVFSTLSAWLRSDGVEVAAIGFFAWIGMLYSIKFFGHRWWTGLNYRYSPEPLASGAAGCCLPRG